MALPAELRVTTEVLWRGALLFAVVDLPLFAFLVWRTRGVSFAGLKGPLLATTAVFWFGLWLWAVLTLWGSVYSHVFPAWSRWLLPPFQATLASLIGWGLWWVACRVPGRSVLTFLLGGGVWGIVSHVIAILRGLLDKPPMLEGASPAAALTLAFFEFTFYWSVILAVALVLRRAFRPRPSATAATR